MASFQYNCNEPLPEQYESLMPSGLSLIDQNRWREHKLGELLMKKQISLDNQGNVIFNHPSESAVANFADENLAPTEGLESYGQEIQQKDEECICLKSKTKTSRRSSVSIPKSSDSGYEDIRTVPRSVIQAIRRQFPETASKSDLISAVAYIFTNGDCEISERAMAIVKSYQSDNALATINERLSHLERENKRHLELLQSIELCTCYNTFDRRYGSSEQRRSPKLTEFREQDNLDMLERLREQARDQIRIDDLARGRQIYNQTKDLND